MAVLDALPTALQAARDAESLWKSARDNTKQKDQVARETAGFALRSEMLSACRYHLKKDRAALAVVSAIAQGEGVADMVQDLNDLAELITKHSGAFADDQSFDAARAAESARTLGPEIAAGAARGGPPGAGHIEAKNLRDRAYTYLDDLVDDIREAGKYAYRGSDDYQRKFTSPYLRRKRRRSASPQQPVAPEPVLDADS